MPLRDFRKDTLSVFSDSRKFARMRTSIRETIQTYGTTALAEAIGLPISTIHDWKRANAIPGKGTMHDMRVQAFEAAVKSLKKAAKRSRKVA